MLISEAFTVYATDVIAFRNQSKKTEENHYICMKSLIVFFDDVEVSSLNFAMIRDWKIALERTRSQSTVRNYIIKLRVVLTFLHNRGEPVLNPEQIPVPQRADTVPSYIGSDDVSKLIDSCSVARGNKINAIRNQAIISLLYASGIRVSELCSLNRAAIKDNSFTVVGKGSKARLCFLDERTVALLALYESERIDNCPALFVSNETLLRITAGTVQEVFKNVRKRCNLPSVSPHTMRHSFATNLLKNNMNMRYVQELLGHKSLDTTAMYTHVVNEDLRKVYDIHHTI